ESLPMRLAALAQHAFKTGSGVLVDKKLPRVGPAFFEHGGRLAPDQLRAPGAEPLITAKGQLVGMSVERAVAPFHRLDAECVADPKRPDRNGPEERTEVVAETEIETETLALGGEVVERMVFEVACQV